ncbi:hypothetical protein K1X12_13190 [Hyphomonas sp. WL0036]|uniref:hypothetical protein n=1 Tax=Hyphomonas sediminis TaxID=2866160 RepID=UPI001C7FD095|nr:hypothetical protein [Hyphomonas sediminis]MBY9067859.1 hypothetical protein [Hyphomonas sediminis]
MKTPIRIMMMSAMSVLGACQGTLRPAVLADKSPETMAEVTGVLAKAVNRAQIQLGASDPTVQSMISVLPPPPGPHESNSPAMPIVFDIVLMGEDCYVRSREGGEMYALSGIACAPAEAGN